MGLIWHWITIFLIRGGFYKTFEVYENRRKFWCFAHPWIRNVTVRKSIFNVLWRLAEIEVLYPMTLPRQSISSDIRYSFETSGRWPPDFVCAMPRILCPTALRSKSRTSSGLHSEFSMKLIQPSSSGSPLFTTKTLQMRAYMALTKAYEYLIRSTLEFTNCSDRSCLSTRARWLKIIYTP